MQLQEVLLLVSRPAVGLVPLHQQRQQKGKKGGQTAFLQKAIPLGWHGEQDGDGHNRPAATVTLRVKLWRQQGCHTRAGNAGRAWGFSKREWIWIYESVLRSAPNHPQEPARSGYFVHKSGSCTKFQFSISVHLNNFQIFSTSPV